MTEDPSIIVLTIPGVPVAQGRGRAVRIGNGVRVIDPAASRSWKGAATVHMLAARAACHVSAPLVGPLSLSIEAVWPRPKWMPKKQSGATAWRASRPDADNVAKAVMDAGNSVLWLDDAQVVDLRVSKRYAYVGETPGVCIVVTHTQEVA